MGFDINGVKLLIQAKKLGVNFENVITIGRQGLHLKKPEMRQLLKEAGLISDNISEIFKNDNYAEPFLKLLGGKITDSLDASNYEHATIIHDLNRPISNKLKSKYSVVIDGGSLEHVFNFPVAIKNCMDLIQKNGFYIGITPTNNFFGHGFYQFSPELYYRVFNESNGFEVLKMYFYIDNKKTSFYEVLDPLKVHQRVTLLNSYPSYLFIIAKRVEVKEIFEQTPQQSDYEQIQWINKSNTNSGVKTNQIKQLIPSYIKRGYWKLLANYITLVGKFRSTGNSNPQFFIKTSKSNIHSETLSKGQLSPTNENS